MAFKSYAKVLTWLALKNAAVYNYFKGKTLAIESQPLLSSQFLCEKITNLLKFWRAHRGGLNSIFIIQNHTADC